MNIKQLVNKNILIRNRNRILKKKNNNKFLYNELENRISESFKIIDKKFNKCLEIGCNSTSLFKKINKKKIINTYIFSDISEIALYNIGNKQLRVCNDYDNLPFVENCFDLILSNFVLQSSNNALHCIKNIYRLLENKGLILLSLAGKNSMHQLKFSMIQTDNKIYDGVSPRFLNLPDFESFVNLSQSLNLYMPVIDRDIITYKYKKFSNLINDVRNLGNTNILLNKKQKFEKKKYFQKLEEEYWKNYENDGYISLSFEVINISGWKNNPFN